MTTLSIWTVYWSPKDHPEKYVARRWEIAPGPEPRPTTDILVEDSIVDLRRQIPSGLMNLPHLDEEDACIVEVWV